MFPVGAHYHEINRFSDILVIKRGVSVHRQYDRYV